MAPISGRILTQKIGVFFLCLTMASLGFHVWMVQSQSQCQCGESSAPVAAWSRASAWMKDPLSAFKGTPDRVLSKHNEDAHALDLTAPAPPPPPPPPPKESCPKCPVVKCPAVKCPPPPPPPPPPRCPVATQTETAIAPRTTYYTQKFSFAGWGNKMAELVMGVKYAKDHGLQYLFNYDTFMINPRDADHKWIADLIGKRFPSLNYDHKFIELRDYWEDQPLDPVQIAKGYDGLVGTGSTTCSRDTCYVIGYSFLSGCPELADLLGPLERVHRITAHLRFGDIQTHLTPENYLKIIQGLEAKDPINNANLMDNVHFVYYSSWDTEEILGKLKETFPKAQFHNIQRVEDSVRFLASSSHMITSGSSMSYIAGYLCQGCHVVYTSPKDMMNHYIPMNDTNYVQNIFYYTGFDPVHHYIDG